MGRFGRRVDSFGSARGLDLDLDFVWILDLGFGSWIWVLDFDSDLDLGFGFGHERETTDRPPAPRSSIMKELQPTQQRHRTASKQIEPPVTKVFWYECKTILRHYVYFASLSIYSTYS